MKFSPKQAIRVLAELASEETSQGEDAGMFLSWLATMERKARADKPRTGWVAGKGELVFAEEVEESALPMIRKILARIVSASARKAIPNQTAEITLKFEKVNGNVFDVEITTDLDEWQTEKILREIHSLIFPEKANRQQGRKSR